MISKKIESISPSLTLEITAKAKSLKSKGVDVVDFAAGEPDFDTPGYVKKAGIEAIEKGLTKYTPASGTQELKEAICKKFKDDNGLVYKPSQVVVSCGAKHALYNIFQALCEEGDEVLLPSPYWLSYPEMVNLSGAKPVILESDRNTFTVAPEKVERSITKNTKALVLNSPSNPAGAVYQKKALEELAAIAIRRNIFVISDEIYEKLIYDGLKHISIASLNDEIYGRTLVVNGVSKSYAMTGWRIGYVAGREDVIKAVSALQSHSTSNPCSISQAASVAAISSDDGTLGRMCEEFENRRNVLLKGLKKIKGVECNVPRGAFYCFVDISATGMDGITFSKKFLDEKHVATIPGGPFGMKNHVRMSFATSIPDIEKGLKRLEEWLRR